MPMAQDHRLPDDTLWFIIEEDFRWYPEGEDPSKSDGYLSRAESSKKKRDALTTSLPPRGTIALDLPTGQDPREPTATGKGKGKKSKSQEEQQEHTQEQCTKAKRVA